MGLNLQFKFNPKYINGLAITANLMNFVYKISKIRASCNTKEQLELCDDWIKYKLKINQRGLFYSEFLIIKDLSLVMRRRSNKRKIK